MSRTASFRDVADRDLINVAVVLSVHACMRKEVLVLWLPWWMSWNFKRVVHSLSKSLFWTLVLILCSTCVTAHVFPHCAENRPTVGNKLIFYHYTLLFKLNVESLYINLWHTFDLFTKFEVHHCSPLILKQCHQAQRPNRFFHFISFLTLLKIRFSTLPPVVLVILSPSKTSCCQV